MGRTEQPAVSERPGPAAVARARALHLRKQMAWLSAGAVVLWLALGLSTSLALLELNRTSSEMLQVSTRKLRLLSRLRGTKENMYRLAASYVLSGLPNDIDGQLAAADRTFAEGASDFATLPQTQSAQETTFQHVQSVQQSLRALLGQAVDAREHDQLPAARSYLVLAQAKSLDADSAYDELTRQDARRVDGLAGTLGQRILRIGALNLLALVVGVAATVTLVRLALSALRSYGDDMQQRIEDLDLFAGRLVHDIRQPLTSLSLMLGGVSRKVDDPTLLASMKRGTQLIARLSHMAEDLLSFSQAGLSGQPPPPLLPGAVIREVVEEVASQPSAAGVDWTVELRSARAVRIGPAQLRMVLWNLLDNAVKYMAQSPSRRIAVHLEDRAGSVAVDIADTGPGISTDSLEKMFQPYFRGSHAAPGFGVGLATVKRLVDANSGAIAVDSKLGEGTRFCVSFPAVAEVGTTGPAA